MYGSPKSLFVAEFMGNNNRITGRVTNIDGDQASIEGDGWQLKGLLKSALKPGDQATAVIRLEQLKLAETPGENRISMPLITSVYLGNTWEHLFDLSGMKLRGYGKEAVQPGERLVEIPADQLWIF